MNFYSKIKWLISLSSLLHFEKIVTIEGANLIEQRVIYGEVKIAGTKFSTECTCKVPFEKKLIKGNCSGISPKVIENDFFKQEELKIVPVTPISKESFSCIDGRTTERGYSTPGGDAGEFLLALHVYEQLTLSTGTMSFNMVKNALEHFLLYSRATQFRFCTDYKAIESMFRQAGVISKVF